MSDVVHMGGYAGFVWPSIGFVLAVLIWNIWAARRQLRLALRQARHAMDAAEAKVQR